MLLLSRYAEQSLLLQICGRQPTFDQMIVNGYQPGEGISSHVDLLKFENGIAIISLGSPATMTFTQEDSVQTHLTNVCPSAKDILRDEPASQGPVHKRNMQTGCCDTELAQHRVDTFAALESQEVFLQSGDLLLMQGEARYGWKHGIAFNQPCSIQSSQQRMSITLRKLVQT